MTIIPNINKKSNFIQLKTRVKISPHPTYKIKRNAATKIKKKETQNKVGQGIQRSTSQIEKPKKKLVFKLSSPVWTTSCHQFQMRLVLVLSWYQKYQKLVLKVSLIKASVEW